MIILSIITQIGKIVLNLILNLRIAGINRVIMHHKILGITKTVIMSGELLPTTLRMTDPKEMILREGEF